MTRFLKATCAVSVLALAYAAHATSGADTTSSQMTITGKVVPYCTIATGYDAPVWHTTYPNSQTTDATGLTINFNTFANADGTGNQLAGYYSMNVDSNASCNYVLTSTNGSLKNLDNDQAFRPYGANAHRLDPSVQPPSSLPVNLSSLSGGIVNTFAIDATSPARNTVAIDVYIPTSGVLTSGHYSDTLKITVAPK